MHDCIKCMIVIKFLKTIWVFYFFNFILCTREKVIVEGKQISVVMKKLYSIYLKSRAETN